jgi:protein-S-isoprenylcysteine O-methyltransferase Ste14
MSWQTVVALSCWGVVVVVWIAGGIYGARKAPGTRHGRDRGALWQLGAVILVVAIYRLGGQYLRRFRDDSLWIELPGLTLLLVSTAFTLWARFRLGRMWSASPSSLRQGHELRTDGPYAITRHPIYTGLLGMALGSVLLSGLGVSLGVLAVVATVLVGRIPIEERLMEKTFPDEYPRYRERVPRLVPTLRSLTHRPR